MAKKREDTLIRRRQIINAARKLIIKYGSEHVTVRKMAEEIGVSEGAIYRHFRSKRDILSLLIDDVESNLLAEIQFTLSDGSFTLETLQSIITGHMSRVVQRKGTSFQVIAEIVSLGDKWLNKKAFSLVSNYINQIRDILAAGVKVGAVKPERDLDAAATLFFGMTQGLVNLWTLSGYNFDFKDKYASLWEIYREVIIKY